jgi:hypothetical protein
MDFTASQKITKTTVTPVGNTPQLPGNLTPGFYSAYDAIYRKQKEDERGKKQEQKKSTLNAKKEENPDAIEGQKDFPEIFELLNTYSFKDFFQLMLSGDDAQMMLIIKKKRASRGVDQSVSLSNKHRGSDDYINKTGSAYRNSNWLMEAKPGKAYTGTL